MLFEKKVSSCFKYDMVLYIIKHASFFVKQAIPCFSTDVDLVSCVRFLKAWYT